MDKIGIGAATALALALAGCATTEASEPTPSVDELLGQCDAEAGQELVGHEASGETGQRLLHVTGARQLRWAPPRSAMTMDYRSDRLTVAYDDDMVIRRVSCG